MLIYSRLLPLAITASSSLITRQLILFFDSRSPRASSSFFCADAEESIGINRGTGPDAGTIIIVIIIAISRRGYSSSEARRLRCAPHVVPASAVADTRDPRVSRHHSCPPDQPLIYHTHTLGGAVERIPIYTYHYT